MHIHMDRYKHMYIDMHICIYICTYMYICICVYMYMCWWYSECSRRVVHSHGTAVDKMGVDRLLQSITGEEMLLGASR